jgi:hypothetical protein
MESCHLSRCDSKWDCRCHAQCHLSFIASIIKKKQETGQGRTEKGPALIAPGGDMIKGARELNSRGSHHDFIRNFLNAEIKP